ncbi:hypothetical protein DVR12_25165 [Chitinophaga silvatica]|uniref:Uncharacterized protein n=1 Tax=Chitinophaga silvatica TaxID=2282649 RepID=A0A3E1Y317_9BACT|nr:hypothetical protein [Chitinophaga silvatica]RFS19100.1 hypothetical protein DVR12_25165 [Chitinophaga silvatica]
MRYLKWLILVAVSGAWNLSTQAQVPVVTLGPEFTVPEDGWDKLLQLKNGNTCYLNFNKKNGLTVTVYNSKREIVANDTINTQIWKATDLESTEVDGIFEINGQPVLFLQQLVKNSPILIRLVLDANTGKLLQEDKLGELPTVLHKSVMVSENLASHDFYVEKDPKSDYYAIAAFNGSPIQKTDSLHERISITHYSPSHKEINKGWFYLQDTSYNYFSYINMAVAGKEKVYLATVGFNTKKETAVGEPKVFFSALSPDSATFAHQIIPATTGASNVSGDIQLAEQIGQIRMLLHLPAQQNGNNAGTRVYEFSTATGKLVKHVPVALSELDRNAAEHLNYQEPFKGTPQRWQLNPDGTSTLMLEKLTFFTQGNSQLSKFHTNLGDVGIALLDTSSRESNTLAVSKYQVINGVCEPFQLQRRSKSEWIFRNKIAALNTSTYMSYDFIQIPNASFVLFNDYLQYLDTGGQDRVRKPLKYAIDANFVCYRFYNGKIDKLMLFGNPETTKGYGCMMGAADYNADKKIYATLLISRKGQERKANIAWIQF